jgi:SET domain-containing protein
MPGSRPGMQLSLCPATRSVYIVSPAARRCESLHPAGAPLGSSGDPNVLIKVDRSPLHGHGCFATRSVAAGEIVSLARLLIFPPEDMQALFRTGLRNYLFYLKDGDADDAPYYTALAMGPITFCNHSSDPNCEFRLDEEAAEITVTARRSLATNEEITIDYGDYAEEIV